MLTFLAYVTGSVILKKSVKWGTIINPVLLTLAIAFERPVLPIYRQDFQVWNSCTNISCTYLIPWFICETLAGQLVSFTIAFSACIIQNHIHF